MPESAHAELTRPVREDGGRRRRTDVFEIVEVLVLAIVAVATAWSGYQAAQWDGEQTRLYGVATRDRFAADAAATLGGQRLAADTAVFTAWLQAEQAGDARLQAVLARRFTPEYRTAFQEWLETSPLTDPAAAPGPGYLPQYRNPALERAEQLNARAAAVFDRGTAAGDTGDHYMRGTVLLASVLFMMTIAQRLEVRTVRLLASGIGWIVLAYTLFSLSTLPRI